MKHFHLHNFDIGESNTRSMPEYSEQTGKGDRAVPCPSVLEEKDHSGNRESGLTAYLSVAFDDVFISGEFAQGHGAAGV